MAKNAWDHFGNNISRDLLDFCTGACIGSGVSRGVYVYGPDPKYVLKIETEEGWWQNIMEWETYQEAKDTPAGKWFAPCERISDNGKILLQRRTNPLGWRERPKKMPRFFTDLKLTNFGTIDGQVVAHDYGLSRIVRLGLSCQMRKAVWWQVNEGESDG